MMAHDTNDRAGPPRTNPRLREEKDLQQENSQLRTRLEVAEAVALRTSLLMREADHRIKNSLQIVSSLMNLDADKQENASVRDILRSASARVQSIARIHDSLQQAGGADEVDLRDALGTMGTSLQAMAGDRCRISTVMGPEPILTSIALAQPVALAANELVINAIRHAFPDGRAGTIRVTAIRAGGDLHVSVVDDGVGLPPDFDTGLGYGSKLVRMMVQQIHGTLKVSAQPGAAFDIVAPIHSPAFA